MSPAAGWLDALARRRASWVVVLAVALVVRLAFVVTAPRGIPWADGRAYEAAGWTLASEHRYVGSSYLPPGYIVFIAGVYSVAGHDLRALRLTEAVISTATVGLIGAFGAALLGPAAGLLAAVLAASHPILAFLPITQYIETLLLAVAVLAFGVFGSALQRPSALRFGSAGALFGVALLCKPALIAVLPGLALGTVARLWRRGLGSLVRWGALFTVALVVVVTPWIVRNHETYGRWFFVTTGGGKQFWMGNNPVYEGSTQVNPKPTGALADSLAACHSYAEQEQLFYREGRRFVREHPALAVRNYLLKLRNVWELYPQTQTRTRYSVPAADIVQAVASVILYAGAVAGISAIVAAGLGAFPLGIASYTLMVSMYLTVMRYRMAVEVLLLWMAGAGWAALLQRRGAGARRDDGRGARPAG